VKVNEPYFEVNECDIEFPYQYAVTLFNAFTQIDCDTEETTHHFIIIDYVYNWYYLFILH